MNPADAINASFELLAGLFVLNHCRVLHQHKLVRGVSLDSVGFFTLWGIWNLYYYPTLNQPMSFWGGICVCAANAFYLGMALYYINLEPFDCMPDDAEQYMAPESVGMQYNKENQS